METNDLSILATGGMVLYYTLLNWRWSGLMDVTLDSGLQQGRPEGVRLDTKGLASLGLQKWPKVVSLSFIRVSFQRIGPKAIL